MLGGRGQCPGTMARQALKEKCVHVHVVVAILIAVYVAFVVHLLQNVHYEDGLYEEEN